MDTKLIEWVRTNLTYRQAVELAEILSEIAHKTKSITTQRTASSIMKAGTGH